MRRRLKRVSFSYLLMFLLVLALSLTLSAKKAGAGPIWLGNTKDAMDLQELYATYRKIKLLDSLESEDIHHDEKRFTEDYIWTIKRHKSYVEGRKIGLLDSLESKDIQDGGRRLTKDNVWIVREGVSVFVTPRYGLSVLSVLSLREAENHKAIEATVERDVYDETNEDILIPKGSRIKGPTDVIIADGQIRLTITGNYILDPVYRIGGPRKYLVEPRVRNPDRFQSAADPAEWRADILKNPPLSATLLSLESDEIEEIYPSKMRLSRDSEGQLHLLLPEIIELIVRRPLFFSYPWDHSIYDSIR